MSGNTQSILLSALLSAVIFLLILNAGLDFIFMFLCVIPLLAVGLSRSPKVALHAGALATIPIAIITGSAGAMTMFYLLFGLPSWYICHMAMRYYDVRISPTLPSIRLWYPMGLITMYLSLYGVILVSIVTALMSTQEENLPQSLIKPSEDVISFLSKNYNIQIELSAQSVSFFLISSSIWMWCLLFLLYTWFTNRSLAHRNMAKRPSISFTVFSLPHWLLSLMGICVLAAGIGGESMSFLGKASLLVLLIPYFFQGLAMLHYDMRNWPNKRIFLFILYFAIVLFVWPIMLVSGIGLWNHIKILNKHLSSGGTSSKS